MNRVLQLGFQTSIFLNPSSCAVTVTLRNVRVVPLFCLRAIAAGSKRLFSNSSGSILSISGEKEGKGLRRLLVIDQNSDMSVAEDNSVNDKDEVQGMDDYSGKIEEMTVQELRAALRRIGVPAKGRKQDLVSALRCYLSKKTNGDSSSVAEEIVLSSHAESVLLKRNIQKTSDEDVDTASKVSEFQHRTKRVKQAVVDDTTAKVYSRTVRTKQKPSIKTEEVSGQKLHQSKQEVGSEIGNVNVKVEEVNLLLNQSEPWTILAHKKPQKEWRSYNPRTMRLPPLTRDTKSVKLMSWNVNGLRALLKLEGFSALQLAQKENFDILCLQETKLQERDVESIKQSLIDGYENSFWTCSVSKLGYSGTAIISRIKPISVRYGLGISDHDTEGRLVTAEFDSFYLISAYVPNSGDGLKRLSYRITEWDPSLSNYMKELEKSKPVILTGDLNCAHEEIDIFNPAGNRRSAGFTDEERQSFGTNFLCQGYVDTFRKQHPDVVGYTYWGYRHGGRKTNKGWRLDYFLVSESISENVHDSYILPEITGSDHCPIGLILKL